VARYFQVGFTVIPIVGARNKMVYMLPQNDIAISLVIDDLSDFA
jgi:hypothetical protein